MKPQSSEQRKVQRAINLYGLPLISLGVLGWMVTTDPPAIVMLAAVTVWAPALLGIARHEGYMDGLRWAKDRVEQEGQS